jgi:hypothetical protein
MAQESPHEYTVRFAFSEILWNPKVFSRAKTWVEGCEKVPEGSHLM